MTDERVEPRLPSWLQPSRRTASLLITPIIILVIASYAGDALTTSWSRDHPLALLTLNARVRILALTTNHLDAVSYYGVGAARLLISDPLFFLVGMLYGDKAIEWVERKSKTFGEQVRIYEKAFAKASYPLVFIAPNNFICTFAGAAGMSLGWFVLLNVTGTFARLWLVRLVGDTFADPLDAVQDFFAEYRLELFILSVVSVLLVVLVDMRRGKSEIGALIELEHELAEEPAEKADD